MIGTKGSRIALMAIIVVLLAIGCALVRSPEPETLSRVRMFDVGQGDSALIETREGVQLLIDGGKDATVLGELAKHMKWNDKYIDVVIATHPDADHIGGLVDVLERYEVGLFLTSDVHADTEIYTSLMTLVSDKEIPAYYVRSGMKLSLDTVLNTDFTILFPDRDTGTWETNTASIVGRLDIGERSMLFTGDSPISVEQYLTKKVGTGLDVDILKLGHHGSKTSTSAEYLRATTPELALISAGKGNSYGHPHQQVLDILKQFRIPSLSTQTDGTVTFETDGVKWYRNK